MLAMEVNDDTGSLTPRGALRGVRCPASSLTTIASMLAPTVRAKPSVAVTAAMDTPPIQLLTNPMLK
jgi:hypothetical protein